MIITLFDTTQAVHFIETFSFISLFLLWLIFMVIVFFQHSSMKVFVNAYNGKELDERIGLLTNLASVWDIMLGFDHLMAPLIGNTRKYVLFM